MTIILEAVGRLVVWELLAVALSFSLWPIYGRLFSPRIAWSACRLTAPLLVSYLLLLPAVFLPQTPFTPEGAAGLVLLLTMALWGWDLRKGRIAWAALGERDWRHFEALRAVTLAAGAVYVSFIPELSGMGERMRDTALWSSLLVQKAFPFEEPWIAGTPVKYYVFGYYPHALLALFNGTAPLVAYNLALVNAAVQYVGGLYLLFVSMGWPLGRSVTGAATVFLASNGQCLVQAIQWVYAGTNYNWWNVTRVIEGTINEFPFWTATLGDLHPHYLAMGLFALIAACAVGLVRGAREGDSFSAELRRVSLGAFLMGCMWGTNTWEVPVAGGILGISCLAGWRARGPRKTLGLVALIPLLSIITASPFLRHAGGAERAFGLVQQRSDATSLFLVFGLFFLPWMILPLVRWWDSERREWLVGVVLLFGLSFAINSVLLCLLAVGVLMAMSVLFEKENSSFHLAGLMALFALGILVFCEFFHLRDVYGTGLQRLNTVFKFYMPAWTLLGSSAVVAAHHLAAPLPRRWGLGVLTVWGFALSAHLLVGLNARTAGSRGPSSLTGLKLVADSSADDAALIEWASQEARAGRLRGVLMEAVGNSYSLSQRFSSAIGLPSLVGWQGYGYYSIQGMHDLAVSRTKTLRDLWSGKAWGEGAALCPAVKEAVAKAGISYVAIGAFERRDNPPSTIDALERCLTVVNRIGKAVLLSVN